MTDNKTPLKQLSSQRPSGEFGCVGALCVILGLMMPFFGLFLIASSSQPPPPLLRVVVLVASIAGGVGLIAWVLREAKRGKRSDAPFAEKKTSSLDDTTEEESIIHYGSGGAGFFGLFVAIILIMFAISIGSIKFR